MISAIRFAPVRVDRVSINKIHTIDVLRTDLVHPVVSGNKWFKLKAYLNDAQLKNKNCLLTFGGAFSNHIIATATTAQFSGFKSIGIIRGEADNGLSHTLKNAEAYGMKLFFISREAYRQKTIPARVFEEYNEDDIYLVNEGGYGSLGAKGAAGILETCDCYAYDHILAACGTGTMLAGLVLASSPSQTITGISVLKNNFSLQDSINALLPAEKNNKFQLLHDFHLGGYAKYNSELIKFMNAWYEKSGIPTDFVYTAKLFYGVNNMIENNFFKPADKILVVHSGGLQGNLSLPNQTLIF
jgi:1-aminocyclopropane-1-carboxylate deaminase